VLGVHYDATSGEERLSDGQGRLWLATRYTAGLLPQSWTLTEGGRRRCTQKYDR